MKKNTKILIVISIALALSVLAGFLVVRLISPQRETVYLFNSSYSAGTTLTSDMLTAIQIDANIVTLGVKSNVNQRFVTSSEYSQIIRSGDSLKIDVGKGMPLMMSMLSVAGGNSIEMLMKPSAIAVSISVNGVKGVTNELEAGSRVNVYYTTGTGTKLLFESMRVLAVSKTNSGVLSAVSLEANHEEAAILINAAESGSLYLGLVNANGYQYQVKETPTPEPTAAPTEEPTPEPSPEPPAETPDPDEILQPDTVTDVIVTDQP